MIFQLSMYLECFLNGTGMCDFLEELSPLLFIDVLDKLLFLQIIIIKTTGFVQLSEWLLNFDWKLMVFCQKKSKLLKANIRLINNSLKLFKFLFRKTDVHLPVDLATLIQESQKVCKEKVSFRTDKAQTLAQGLIYESEDKYTKVVSNDMCFILSL